ncbi:PAS domain S-box protein [Poseidonibacter sp.]|uniref:PAS domain S-box protein n=1 Tax=Poseidonibacter sp. TaxID=2321188 RepID=UPI003C74BAB0
MANIKIFSLRNRYIPALIIIFIVSSFAYMNVKDIMASIKNDGKIINISGKQRMLSQRLVLLAQDYLDNPNIKTKQILNENLLLLSTSHEFLLEHIYSQKLDELFFKDKLDEEVKRYINLFEQLILTNNQNLLIELRKTSQYILPKLEEVVKEYERIDKEKLEKLERKELFILLLTIFVLFLEAIFIFYPASKKIRKNTDELEELVFDKTKELQKSIDIISNYVIYSRTDLKGIITYASNAFCKTSGFSRDELIGQPHNIVRHEDMPSSAFEEMWNTIKSGKIWKGEVKNKTKSGGFYWVDANISPEYDTKGNLIGYAGVRLNITSKKKIEELNKNLEKRILEEVEKNREKDKQLHEQAKMIQMGELIGNIAHQWRQPLSLISTSVSGLKLQKELNMLSDDEYYKTLDNIISKTQELSKTIDTFSSFIKEDNTKTLFILQEKVEQTINIISNTLENHKIKIVKNFDKEPFEIYARPYLVSQAVLNIITNSKDILIEKQIPNPVIKICIKRSKDKIKIIIEDNAGGIDANIIDKVFEPYFTTKHQSQGTGMGLHNSYNFIVKELQGIIYVKNSDIGAVFVINIPFEENRKALDI